jgi:hypothetical protein
MRSLRPYHFIALFLVTLAFCSVMVIRQIHANQSRHVRLREAFILLHTRGYTNEARFLYQGLLDEAGTLSDTQLLDDFQRTLMVVDPTISAPQNLIYNYHWYISSELDRRSSKALRRALDLADEERRRMTQGQGKPR